MKILIVEDEIIFALSLSMLLEKMGLLNCKIATKGEEAITQADGLQPDLILMDINLPGEIDGIEAARRIQKNQEVPIFFITGFSTQSYRQQIKEIANHKYFTKPLDMKLFKEALQAQFPNLSIT